MSAAPVRVGDLVCAPGELAKGSLLAGYERDGAELRVPTLVMNGGKSPEYLRNTMKNVAEVLGDVEYQELPGQTHMLKSSAAAPVLVEFFSRAQRTAGPIA